MPYVKQSMVDIFLYCNHAMLLLCYKNIIGFIVEKSLVHWKWFEQTIQAINYFYITYRS